MILNALAIGSVYLILAIALWVLVRMIGVVARLVGQPRKDNRGVSCHQTPLDAVDVSLRDLDSPTHDGKSVSVDCEAMYGNLQGLEESNLDAFIQAIESSLTRIHEIRHEWMVQIDSYELMDCRDEAGCV